MPYNAAELHGVQKVYKDFKLGPLDLTVPAGTIVGLVGENGAGKTTTLKILTGVNPPDGGRAELLGGLPKDPEVRARLGVVFEEAYFYEGMNAAHIGRSMAGIFGARWDAGAFSGYLKRFGLEPDKKIKEYSRGMRMKLSLATALAHAPEMLVLDEPTAGLDPVVRGEILDLFLEFIQDEHHTILMSSHITSDLEQIADSIAYLHHGQLLFHEDKDALMQEYGLLRCSEADLHRLPDGMAVFTRRSTFGCETLVKGREAVLRLLPGTVCDPAGIDDIMRFYSGRDGQ
ncbi:ABC transporter ATP-binding protein [uncultured Gemmiger sp.]|uniref:ABC transporter ATP-binding protein n=1 Tax=uncultured Gemmiger sp. TaxID=1623490 RepID=UPI0025FAA96F|nr:ABC transporter ATP-binding protein [uncultured Gemmiger sp.]